MIMKKLVVKKKSKSSVQVQGERKPKRKGNPREPIKRKTHIRRERLTIKEKIDVIVINAAAYTHTSIAIHDALKSFPGLKIELHISNPHLRESFRHISFVSPAVDAVVAGLGADGYIHVIELLADLQRS